MMKRLINHLMFLPAAFAAVLAASCGVTEPDPTPWESAANFSWPDTEGAMLKYSVDDENDRIDDVYLMVVQQGNDAIPNGPRMSRKLRTTRESGESVPAWLQLQYLATRDTLYTLNNAGFRATYALIAPLEKGRSWVAAFADQRPDSAIVKATVLERFAYWKLEGKGYNNVVAVRYELVGSVPREEFIRFYAQGIGEILTVHNRYPVSNYQTDAPPLEVTRSVLIESSVSQ